MEINQPKSIIETDTRISIKSAIIYVVINFAIIFAIALMFSEKGRFSHYLYYGYAFSFPIALFAYILMVLARAEKVNAGQGNDWSSSKYKAKEKGIATIAEVVTHEIVQRLKLAKELKLPIKKISILPPICEFVVYLVLAVIFVYWGAYVQADTYQPWMKDEMYDYSFKIFVFVASVYTFAYMFVSFSIRRLVTLPSIAEMERLKMMKYAGSIDWATEQDIINALK